VICFGKVCFRFPTPWKVSDLSAGKLSNIVATFFSETFAVGKRFKHQLRYLADDKARAIFRVGVIASRMADFADWKVNDLTTGGMLSAISHAPTSGAFALGKRFRLPDRPGKHAEEHARELDRLRHPRRNCHEDSLHAFSGGAEHLGKGCSLCIGNDR